MGVGRCRYPSLDVLIPMPSRDNLSRIVPDYIIRKIDDALWRKVKARAEAEGRSIRWVIVEMLKRYVKDGV